jgi:hypothetical protein
MASAVLSSKRGEPLVRAREGMLTVEEGRYKATWKREFTLPWRKAGPLK